MKKLSALCGLLSFLLAAGLWAADFWQSKPFTEWTDKDVNRMVTDSPWAHRVTVSLGGAAPDLGVSGGRRGETPGGASDPARPLDAGGGSIPGDAGSGGLGGGGGAGARGSRQLDDPMGGASGQSATLIVRWYTALPMKQAITRSKYGSEAGTSPEAKKFLERADPDYVIAVSGIPKTFTGGDQEKLKKAVKEQTALNVKGRAPVGPSDVQFAPTERSVDAFFVFPKTASFTLDDKEVEFATRIGTLTVRYKFRLKDMVYNGKLEL
jgi:hypothetical protein